MHWLNKQRASSSMRTKLAPRAWRPELLEPRLALSVAPAADDGHLAESLASAHSAGTDSQRTLFDTHGIYTSSAAASTSGVSLTSSSPPTGSEWLTHAVSSTSPADSIVTKGLAGAGSAPANGNVSAAVAGPGSSNDELGGAGGTVDSHAAVGQNLLKYQSVYGGVMVFAPPPPASSPLDPDLDGAAAHNAMVALVDETALAMLSTLHSVEDSVVTVTVTIGRPADSSNAIHSLADASTGNAGSPNAALALVLPGGDQPATTHISAAMQTASTVATQNVSAVAATNVVPVALNNNAVYRASDPDRPAVVAVLPQLEHTPLRRETTSVARGHLEAFAPASEPASRLEAAIDLSLPTSAAAGNLMAGVAVNFEVIDRALEVTLDEIEQMGGDFVAWLDESDTFMLVSTGAAVLLASAGGYYLSRRRVASLPGKGQEEPSSWLFTHLYIPSVRP